MSILCTIHQLSLYFPEKICFEPFDAQIGGGDRIALIGDNSSGKTSLLRMIAGLSPIADGQIHFHHDVPLGYVAQIPEGFEGLSGSEQFQKALSEAMSLQPELLILDEPTNHLDIDNRRQLLNFLKYYPGAMLISSHDPELLSLIPEKLWAIQNGAVLQFHGTYQDYLREKDILCAQADEQLACLAKDQKATHQQLMKEQKRAKGAKDRAKKDIQNRKWPTVKSHAKMQRASQTSGKKKQHLKDKRDDILNQLTQTARTEAIEPKFYLSAATHSNQSILIIQDGSIGYDKKVIKSHINISLFGQQRLAITGKNGSGKSTLIKAIMSDPSIAKEGEWSVPNKKDIGYLDQHYKEFERDDAVLSSLEALRPDWSHQQLRSHLNDFLFKSNNVVNQFVSSLSGGEKARLSLAKIAACPPKLLILDEVTNNLDLTTRNHVIQCLQKYPGPMIVVSHDEYFLAKIRICQQFLL